MTVTMNKAQSLHAKQPNGVEEKRRRRRKTNGDGFK
jgi:hypothetical protein